MKSLWKVNNLGPEMDPNESKYIRDEVGGTEEEDQKEYP